jgi:hypothetical protein
VANKSRTSSTRERTLLIATLAVSILALLLAGYTYLGPRLSTFVTFNQDDDFEFSNELNNDVSTEDTSVPPPDEDHLPANLPGESSDDETPAPDDDTLPFEEGGEAFQGDCIVGDYRPGGQSIRVEANLTTCFQELGGFAWCRMPGISNPFASENKYNQGNNPVNCFNTVDKDGSTSTCEGCTDGGILGMCFDIKGAFPGQDTAVTEANDCASKGGTFCQPGDHSPECLWDYSTKEGGYQCRVPGTCGEDPYTNDDEEAEESSGRVSEFVFNCVQGSIGSDGLPTKTADDCLAECADDADCSEQLDAASDSGVFDPGEIPGVPDEVPDEAFIFPVQDCLDAGGSFSDCTSQELDRNQESINRAIQDCVDAGGNFRDCAREELVSRCVDYGGNFRDCFSEYGTGGQPDEPGTGDTTFIENPEEFFDLGLDEDGLIPLESEFLRGLSESLDQLRGGHPPETTFDQALRDAFHDNLCTSIPVLCQSGGIFKSFDRWLNNFCKATPAFCQDPSVPGSGAPQSSGPTLPTQEDKKGDASVAQVTCSGYDVGTPDQNVSTTAQFNACLTSGGEICISYLYSDDSTETLCGNAADIEELQEILDENGVINFFTEADRLNADSPRLAPPPSTNVYCGTVSGGKVTGISSMIADKIGYDDCRAGGGVPCVKSTTADAQCSFTNFEDFEKFLKDATARTDAEAAAQAALPENYTMGESLNSWYSAVNSDKAYAEAKKALGEDAALSDLLAYMAQQEEAAARAAAESEERRQEAERVANPDNYAGSLFGEWGYVNDDPRFAWDDWYRNGTCFTPSGYSYNINNSHQAAPCLTPNKQADGWRFFGPDGMQYTSWSQLQNKLNLIRNARQSGGSGGRV